MNVEQTILEIATLPIDVRLRLVSAIWDTLPQDADLTPSALQQAELDRRLSEHREDPGSAISHEEISVATNCSLREKGVGSNS
ncbi:MAG: addiction module protein [Pirellula sp.]